MSDEEDDDRLVIFCMPQSLMRTTTVDGSKTTYCQECAEEVHIAPSSMEMIKTELANNVPVDIVCIKCGIKKYTPDQVGMAPGALEELQRALGLE